MLDEKSVSIFDQDHLCVNNLIHSYVCLDRELNKNKKKYEI